MEEKKLYESPDMEVLRYDFERMLDSQIQLSQGETPNSDGDDGGGDL